MSEDWLVDVKKYVSDADEAAVAGIIRYCGIALRNRDSSLVSFGDPVETGRVRENFLKKKLGLTDSDDSLNAAIASVGERMKGDHFRNRVTVYYLLAEHYGMLGLFKRPAAAEDDAKATPDTVTAGIAGVGLAGAAAGGYQRAASATNENMAASSPAQAFASPGGIGDPGNSSIFSKWWLWLLIALAIIALFLLLRSCHDKPASVAAENAQANAFDNETASAASPAGTVDASPADNGASQPDNGMASAPPAPAGAGVEATMRDGKPALLVYFDTAKTDIPAEFADKSADVKAYLAAHPEAKLAVSGFNDPSGNAAFNAELAKHRAQAVAAALGAVGVPKSAVMLEKPADTTISAPDNSASRRVEVTVK